MEFVSKIRPYEIRPILLDNLEGSYSVIPECMYDLCLRRNRNRKRNSDGNTQSVKKMPTIQNRAGNPKSPTKTENDSSSKWAKIRLTKPTQMEASLQNGNLPHAESENMITSTVPREAEMLGNAVLGETAGKVSHSQPRNGIAKIEPTENETLPLSKTEVVADVCIARDELRVTKSSDRDAALQNHCSGNLSHSPWFILERVQSLSTDNSNMESIDGEEVLQDDNTRKLRESQDLHFELGPGRSLSERNSLPDLKEEADDYVEDDHSLSLQDHSESALKIIDVRSLTDGSFSESPVVGNGTSTDDSHDGNSRYSEEESIVANFSRKLDTENDENEEDISSWTTEQHRYSDFDSEMGDVTEFVHSLDNSRTSQEFLGCETPLEYLDYSVTGWSSDARASGALPRIVEVKSVVNTSPIRHNHVQEDPQIFGSLANSQVEKKVVQLDSSDDDSDVVCISPPPRVSTSSRFSCSSNKSPDSSPVADQQTKTRKYVNAGSSDTSSSPNGNSSTDFLSSPKKPPVSPDNRTPICQLPDSEPSGITEHTENSSFNEDLDDCNADSVEQSSEDSIDFTNQFTRQRNKALSDDSSVPELDSNENIESNDSSLCKNQNSSSIAAKSSDSVSKMQSDRAENGLTAEDYNNDMLKSFYNKSCETNTTRDEGPIPRAELPTENEDISELYSSISIKQHAQLLGLKCLASKSIPQCDSTFSDVSSELFLNMSGAKVPATSFDYLSIMGTLTEGKDYRANFIIY